MSFTKLLCSNLSILLINWITVSLHTPQNKKALFTEEQTIDDVFTNMYATEHFKSGI
jgi:hypothetical protein